MNNFIANLDLHDDYIGQTFKKLKMPIKDKIINFYKSLGVNKADTIILTISLLSLFISFKTCSINDTQLKISKKQGEAYIQVSDVKLVESLESSSFITVELTLKNLGQIQAIKMSGEMDYNIGMFPNNKGGNSASRRQIPNMGQGFETKIQITSNRRNMTNYEGHTKRRGEKFYCYGTIFYTDYFSEEEKKVDWIFELPIKNKNSLSQLELLPCRFFSYQSEYQIQPQ